MSSITALQRAHTQISSNLGRARSAAESAQSLVERFGIGPTSDAVATHAARGLEALATARRDARNLGSQLLIGDDVLRNAHQGERELESAMALSTRSNPASEQLLTRSLDEAVIRLRNSHASALRSIAGIGERPLQRATTRSGTASAGVTAPSASSDDLLLINGRLADDRLDEIPRSAYDEFGDAHVLDDARDAFTGDSFGALY